MVIRDVELAYELLRIMQAAQQSNWFTSNDKINPVQVYGDPDPIMKIGVVNGVRKILVPINRHESPNDDWSKHSDRESMFDESFGVNQMWI